MISTVFKPFLNKKETEEESIRRLEHFVWKTDLVVERDSTEYLSGYKEKIKNNLVIDIKSLNNITYNKVWNISPFQK